MTTTIRHFIRPRGGVPPRAAALRAPALRNAQPRNYSGEIPAARTISA
jgi:hypothetical protein